MSPIPSYTELQSKFLPINILKEQKKQLFQMTSIFTYYLTPQKIINQSIENLKASIGPYETKIQAMEGKTDPSRKGSFMKQNLGGDDEKQLSTFKKDVQILKTGIKKLERGPLLSGDYCLSLAGFTVSLLVGYYFITNYPQR